jgi:hypothetical protein
MNYKLMTRLLTAANQRVWCLSPHTISVLFVVVDVICVILQLAGSVCATLAFAMRAELINQLGNNFLLCSFIVQLALNIVFTALIYWAYKQPQFGPRTSKAPNMAKVWTALIATVSLLWVRNIYRAAEGFATVAGHQSASGGEALFYIFDSVPVLLCCIIFSTWHYGLLLPADDDELAGVMSGAASTSVTSTGLAKEPYGAVISVAWG